MKNELRVVIDTNVVVSAVLLPDSASRKAFDRAFTNGQILVSQATISELQRVLKRPKFEKYITEAMRLEFFNALVHSAEIVSVTEDVKECRDPKDDMFLSLAVSGRATHLVTGDADLLTLNPFRGVSILTPSELMRLPL